MIWELDRSQELSIYFCYVIHKWASLDTVHKVQLSSDEEWALVGRKKPFDLVFDFPGTLIKLPHSISKMIQ